MYSLLFLLIVMISFYGSVGVVKSKNDFSVGSDKSDCNCSDDSMLLEYPIMRPDIDTRKQWLEEYQNATMFTASIWNNKLLSNNQNLRLNHSILSSIDYDPDERDQGTCGNCWVWAATGCLEVALNNQKNIRDRLSIQYLNSNFNSGDGIDWACCGGNINYFCEFYNETEKCISWSNENASWQDGSIRCSDAQSSVSSNQIENVPFYGLDHISFESISTHNVSNSTAINNIKAALDQNIAVSFSFYLPNDSSWSDFFDFWSNENESVVYQMDKFNAVEWNDVEGGGHAVLCVGYNDTVQNNSYWVMLNSWGGPGNRPRGLFRINMSMNYSAINPYGDTDYFAFFWEILNVTFNDIEVDDDGSKDYTSIQNAITDAPPGETIHVYNGTYTEHILIDKNLILLGDESAIIDGTAGTAVNITANSTTFSGFHMTNSTTGIKIYNESFMLQNITLENNTLYNNTQSGSDFVINSINVSNATFSNNTIFNNTNSTAIRLNQTTYSLVHNNTILDNNVGISLCENSSNNTFLSNEFTSNIHNAFIIFVHGGQNNSLTSNIFNGNDEISADNIPAISIADAFNSLYSNRCEQNEGLGCYCVGDEFNSSRGAHHLIFDNNSFSRNSYGLYLFGSCNNSISNNTIQGNNNTGILLKNNSQNNLIYTNRIKNNTLIGLNLSFSGNNSIWNNKFENSINVADNGNNTWNMSKKKSINIINGSYLAGNFWNDYAGFDINGDGIGETPYLINLSNNIYDHLPLTTLNHAPELSLPIPGNQSIDHLPPMINWSLRITDDDGDFFNWTIECNEQSSSNTDDINGSKNIILTDLVNGSRYTVFVNVTDGICWTNATYWFTTQVVTAYVDDDFTKSTPCWNITHFNTIQKAIDNLTGNGSIFVNNGTYCENLLINKSLILQANDFASPVIDGKQDIGLNCSSNFTTIKDIYFRNCTSAIILSNSSDYELHHLFLSQNSFDNCDNCILLDAGFDNRTVMVNNNKFFANNSLGLNVSTGLATVNATKNFWGSITGPMHNSNENGTGILVTDQVDFIPWIGQYGGIIYQDQLQINQTSGLNITETISAIDAHTQLIINSSLETNMSIANYASSPNELPYDLKTVGNGIDIEIENESRVIWPINISIYYTNQDLVEADVIEESLNGIYYFNRSLNTWVIYNHTGVNTTNKDGYEGFCWAQVYRGQLSPKTMGNMNNAPLQPINPSPNATTNVGINPSLQVTVYDADGNHMTVVFFDNQTDTEIDSHRNVSNGSIATVTWSNRAYSTDYEWYVTVNDSITEITSNVYQFKTKSAPPPSNGGSYNFQPPSLSTNPEPIADAGGPYQGYVKRSIQFNGSGSYDDGSIVNFSWDFGDGSTGFGMNPSHIYQTVGNYSVILTVTDDNESTGTNITTVHIDSVPVVPPTAVANGPYIGIVNQDIVFDGFGSYDTDGTIVSYLWHRGDGSSVSGVTPEHSYTSAGTYEVTLTVIDNDGLTGNDTTTATIYDGESVDIPDGYVIDSDGDGSFDSYYNESSGTINEMQKTDDGNYLIDDNDDGTYDETYDPTTGGVSPYSPTPAPEDDGNIWIYIAIIIIIAVIIIIFVLLKMGILVLE